LAHEDTPHPTNNRDTRRIGNIPYQKAMTATAPDDGTPAIRAASGSSSPSSQIGLESWGERGCSKVFYSDLDNEYPWVRLPDSPLQRLRHVSFYSELSFRFRGG